MKKIKKLVSLLLATITVLSLGSMSSFAATEYTSSNTMVNKSIFNVSPRIAQYVWVDTDTLNYRSGPGTSYSILGQVKRDKALWIIMAEYDENGTDWYYSSTIKGWVSSAYVRYEE